jgi:hypothetical protein
MGWVGRRAPEINANPHPSPLTPLRGRCAADRCSGVLLEMVTNLLMVGPDECQQLVMLPAPSTTTEGEQAAGGGGAVYTREHTTHQYLEMLRKKRLI